jgi:hypothetical protein
MKITVKPQQLTRTHFHDIPNNDLFVLENTPGLHAPAGLYLKTDLKNGIIGARYLGAPDDRGTVFEPGQAVLRVLEITVITEPRFQ